MIYFILTFWLGRAHADIAACAEAASSSTLACRQGSIQAKTDADQTAASYQSKVAGKSVKETADLMAEATAKIQQIYQRAEQACQVHVSDCQQKCADREGLSKACAKEMGKFISQNGQGRQSNQDGQEGAERSSGKSSASSSRADGSAPERAERTGGADGGIANETGPGTGLRATETNTHAARLSGGTNAASLAGGTGASPGTANDTSDAAEMARQVAAFCAQGDTRACPSCGDKPRLSNTDYLTVVCKQSCMQDPAYGPELGNRCRTIVGAALRNATGSETGSGGGAGEAAFGDVADKTRELASAALEAGPDRAPVGLALGPALFVIHSRVITHKCHGWGLSRCALGH